MFCLLADIRIREATNGARSLRDALRAIVAAGYDITREAELRPVLELADRAIDTTVLVELYDQMRADPYPDSLDAIWRKLGVARRDGRIVFDDEAPLAKIRRTITAQEL